MAVVPTFWDQGGPLVDALRTWIEKDLHRSIDDIVRIDFHEFTNEVIDPEKDTVTMAFYFTGCFYEMIWTHGHLVSRRTL